MNPKIEETVKVLSREFGLKVSVLGVGRCRIDLSEEAYLVVSTGFRQGDAIGQWRVTAYPRDSAGHHPVVSAMCIEGTPPTAFWSASEGVQATLELMRGVWGRFEAALAAAVPTSEAIRRSILSPTERIRSALAPVCAVCVRAESELRAAAATSAAIERSTETASAAKKVQATPQERQ
jgi:hypothetical protein